MKQIALIVMVFLLCAWIRGNAGPIVNLLDDSSVILTAPAGNLIE